MLDAKSVTLLVALIWIPTSSLATSAATTATPTAAARLEATLRSSLQHAAGLEAGLRQVESAHADALAQTGAGNAYVEYQREGIGSSFDREPNSQDTLRLGLPFKMPWQASTTQEIEQASASRETLASRSLELDTLSASGKLWLNLAAIDERILVVRNRLELFERLVELQKKRLELGEVAGTEVTQLVLAQAGEKVREAELIAERESCQEKLVTFCGPGCEMPIAGDLESLARSIVALAPDSDASGVESMPQAQAAAADQEIAASLAAIASQSTSGFPEIQLEWERFPTLDYQEGYDALGLQLTVPLPWGRKVSRRMQQAQADALAAAATRRAIEGELRQRRASSLHLADSARKQLALLEPLAQDHQRNEYSLAEQFRLGAIPYLVFLDGVARLDAIRVDAIDARAQLLRAHLELASLIDDPALMPKHAMYLDDTTPENTP